MDINKDQKLFQQDNFREDVIEKVTDYLENENKLRKLQPKVLEDIVYDLIEDNWSGVINRPMGSGKTITMGEFDKAVGEKSLILVHSKKSGDQIADKLVSVVGRDSEDVGVYHSGKSDDDKEKALAADTLIITHSSYSNLIRKGVLNYDDYPIAHIDEVHLATNGRRADMIGELDKEAYVLGWTGTDEMLEHGRMKSVSEKLFNRADNIHTTTFQESVEAGEIAPTRNVIFESNINPKIEMRREGYTKEEEQLIISEKGRNEAAVNAFNEFVDEETGFVPSAHESIWYTWGIENAHNLADALNEAFGEGYAVAVSGKTPEKQLDNILEAHKQSEIKALVNSDLLIEAYDNDRIASSVMIRPVKSPRIALQGGARSSHLSEDKDIGYVFSMVDKHQPDVAIFGELVGNMDFVSRGGSYTPGTEGSGGGGRRLPSHGVEVAPIYKERDRIDFFKRRDEELGISDVPRKPEGYLAKYGMADALRTEDKN